VVAVIREEVVAVIREEVVTGAGEERRGEEMVKK
jgi:hypothetical protein